MDRRFSHIIVAGIAVLLGLGSLFAVRTLAQTEGTPWGTAVNISRSGAASQPVIATTSNGLLHVIWWDAAEGEQYARSTNISGTTWTQPVAIPSIYGLRDVDATTGRINLTPPRAIQLIPTARGLHALWIDGKDHLLDIQSDGTSWGRVGITLTEAALEFDVAPDASEALHLAYVRPINTADAPAGIYYRVNTGSGWSTPILVYGSQYFRSAKPGDVSPSVAGDSAGHAIVTWDDPQTGQSMYALTANGGTSWSDPQVVAGPSGGRARQARVASTSNGAWLLISRDTGIGGCGFLQRQSSDGGQTWGAPVKVLSDITRCNESWNFAYGGDGRLWLIGHSASNENATTNSVTAAVWDGTAWSKPADLTFSHYDPGTTQSVSLNCIEAAVAGSSSGIVGCDPKGDIWAAQSTVDLQHLISAAKPVWKPVDFISDQASVLATNNLPALSTDQLGNLFAIWNQAAGAGDNTAKVFGAAQSNDRWSRATSLLRSIEPTNGSTTASQPSMAIDTQGKIHAVWGGGPDGPVTYSWVFARDFNGATAWSDPIALPAAVASSSWPDIAVDSAGKRLFVIYAKPFNEQRGVYLVRSLDGGSTWLTPTLVFDAAAAKWDSIDKPHIALDEQTNVLHATWLKSTLPGSTSARAIYYARSTDQGETWSAPLKIAEGNVDWPQLSLVAGNELYLTWTQPADQATEASPIQYTVWGQYSSDGGQQWSPPDAIPGFEQVSGPAGMHSDSTGNLYLAAVGESPGGESNLIMNHWANQTWGTQEIFGLGQPAARDNAAVIALAPALGRLSVLLQLWTLGQDNQGRFQIGVTGRDVQPVIISPPPTFTPMPTPTLEPTATLQPTPTPRPQLSNVDQQPLASADRGPSPLVLAGVLAAFIVGIVAVRRAIVMRRR